MQNEYMLVPMCMHTQTQNCDDLPWLSICLHLESTKTQDAGHVCILDWTILGRTIHPKSGICLLVAAFLRRYERRMFLLLLCLLIFSCQVHLFCYQGIPSLTLKPIIWDSSIDWRPFETFSLMNRMTAIFLVLPLINRHYYTSQTIVYKLTR